MTTMYESVAVPLIQLTEEVAGAHPRAPVESRRVAVGEGLRRDRGDLISVAAQIVERAAAMVAVEQEAGLDGAARRELADSRAAIEARERRTQK